jgi:hypothetical protein
MATNKEFQQLGKSLNIQKTATSDKIKPSTVSLASSAISGVASVISSVYAARAQKLSFEVEAASRRVQAKQAVSAARLTNLKLNRRYNEITSNQAVTFAAQGRSFASGSIQNILREDQERLNWDLDFNELSGQAGKLGLEAEAKGFEAASMAAGKGAFTKGLLQFGQLVADFKKVK